MTSVANNNSPSPFFTRRLQEIGFSNPLWADSAINVINAEEIMKTHQLRIETFKIKLETNFKEMLAEADNGDTEAQFRVGFMFEIGLGTTVNLDRALYYYGCAAEKGYAKANYYLGVMHQYGMPCDIPLALKNYHKASQAGISKATYEIASIYQYGDKGVKTNLKYAMDFHKKAADEGHVLACFDLAQIYRNKGKHQDAFNYMKKAADSGHDDAQYVLSKMLDKGKGTVPNPVEAKRYRDLAIAQEHKKAIKKS